MVLYNECFLFKVSRSLFGYIGPFHIIACMDYEHTKRVGLVWRAKVLFRYDEYIHSIIIINFTMLVFHDFLIFNAYLRLGRRHHLCAYLGRCLARC